MGVVRSLGSFYGVCIVLKSQLNKILPKTRVYITQKENFQPLAKYILQKQENYPDEQTS